MKQYKINSEAELFANVILQIPGVFNTFRLTTKDEQEAVTSEIRGSLNAIFKAYRIQILKKFFPDWEADMRERKLTFFSYKIPKVPEAMKKLAKEFYDIAQSRFQLFYIYFYKLRPSFM